MCKSPLHGPYNYVAKPKCNFAVRPLYDRSTMLGRLLQTVWVCFLEKKRKRNVVWTFTKRFETMVGQFLVKLHAEHLPEFFISGQWLRASMQQLLRDFWFGAIVGKGACTVISHSSHFGRHSCVARATVICILHIVEVSEVISLATKNYSVEISPQNITIDIPSINPPRKFMEEYWFLAPMSRLAISSALLNIFFFWNSPQQSSRCTGQATRSIAEENYVV